MTNPAQSRVYSYWESSQKYPKKQMWEDAKSLVEHIEILEERLEQKNKEIEQLQDQNEKLAENLERFAPPYPEVRDVIL